MLSVVEEINHALEDFAPEHVRPAHKCMMRIFRDTRFSKNKLPYKQHVSAWWSRRGMEKTSGGGFYLQVGVSEIVVAAGVYMPEREQLLAIRRWMSENHTAYRKLVASASKPSTSRKAGAGESALSAIEPEALTRMPKGFAADDPAAELLRAKNWGVHASLPSSLALDPQFADTVARLFRRANPVVSALNEAIVSGSTGPTSSLRKPLF